MAADIPVDKTAAGTDSRSNVVEIERQVTQRAMIEAVTSVVLVLLYMAYSLLRDRDPGVVVLDSAANDWE